MTTLLTVVQDILEAIESEPVNSLGDSFEATQIAGICRDTFNGMVTSRIIPEHRELIKLTSLSDNTKPTHLKYVGEQIDWINYNVSTDGGTEYRTIKYREPYLFLKLNKYNSDDSVVVSDVNSSTSIIIKNDKMPTYYTSFDDEHVVMDSYDSTVDSVLQESKTQAWGQVRPTFLIQDSYEIDLDNSTFNIFYDESLSTTFSILKSGIDSKVEQRARRSRNWLQNNKFRETRENTRNKYGRG